MFIPKGDERLPPYQFHKIGERCLISFLHIHSPEELLSFIERFGLIYGSGAPGVWGDYVHSALRTAAMFRAVLSQKKLGPAKIASAFRSQLWISQFNANRIDETHRPVREEDLMRLIGSV